MGKVIQLSDLTDFRGEFWQDVLLSIEFLLPCLPVPTPSVPFFLFEKRFAY